MTPAFNYVMIGAMDVCHPETGNSHFPKDVDITFLHH